MSRSRAVISGRSEPLAAAKEPLLTRSLASALAMGAPIGIVIWLALRQMPKVTWLLTQLLHHMGR